MTIILQPYAVKRFFKEDSVTYIEPIKGNTANFGTSRDFSRPYHKGERVGVDINIDEWHNATTMKEAHEWLGITFEQYGEIVEGLEVDVASIEAVKINAMTEHEWAMAGRVNPDTKLFPKGDTWVWLVTLEKKKC